MRRFLILLLSLNAALVFVLQICRVSAWIWICLYWAILTLKNALDWREEQREKQNHILHQ